MKKYIYKINQYLLENYPTVWNTRIVWMLLASIGFHILFFILGVLALSNPETLQKGGATSVFFKSGEVFFSIVISVLQLVVWLIYLFKNNAFKNFYPTAKTKIFLQFICYLGIVFFATTYYFSHYLGLKTYINYKYPNKEVEKDVDIANKSSVFFSHDVYNYTISNCSYPFPFDSIYVGRSNAYSSSYKWLDIEYRFYTMYSINSKDIKGDKPVKGYQYKTETKNGETLYFFKDTVVDVLKYKPNVSTNSDYVLFSEKNFYKDSIYVRYKGMMFKRPTGDLTYAGFIKYKNNKGKIETQYYQSDKQDLTQYKIDVAPSYKYYSHFFYSKAYDDFIYKKPMQPNEFYAQKSKEVYQLLKRNDTVEIKQLLRSFLAVATKYKIKNNISVNEWFNLVYQPEDFKINHFIKKERDYSEVQKMVHFTKEKLTEAETFQYERTTDYYIETPKLNTVFYNITNIKKDTSYKEIIHVFIWLSFLLAFLIFIFRISSLRAFIFTLISAGVLMILVSLIAMLYKYIFGSGFLSNNMVLIISLIISIAIVVVSVFFTRKLSKKIMAIFINLSLVAFMVSVSFIVDLISKYQRSNCSSYSEDCFVLVNRLGLSFSYIMFVVGVAYLYYFSGIIKKWKGLPEE